MLILTLLLKEYILQVECTNAKEVAASIAQS